MFAKSLIVFCLAAAALPAQIPSPAAREARKSPAWVRGAMIYQIWMRSFTPEGTLKAALPRLKHIADLGATVVYLSPLTVQSQAGGFSNPYRIKDYYALDPEYGADADLKAFTAEAHKLNLKVIMDVVFYHTGPDSVLMKTPEFYMRTAEGKIVLGNWRLPRPDFQNAKLREYFVNSLVHWASNFGIDGFRCDVAAGVPLSFWQQARNALDKINPGLMLLAESEMPEEQIEVFDASYSFTYHDAVRGVMLRGEPALRIRQQWENTHRTFPRGAKVAYSNDNHDQDRAIVLYGEQGSWATSVLNFTLDGIPFLYNGQEIGDTTPTDHQARVGLRWDLGKTGRSARGQQRILEQYKSLFKLRREQPALTSGELVWVNNSAPESVLSFLRRKDGEEILVVINLSNRRTTAVLDLMNVDFFPAVDLLTDKRRGTSLAAGRISFSSMQGPNDLGPFEALVLKRLPPQTMEAAPGQPPR